MAASAGLVVLSPLLVIIAVLVGLALGRPVVHRQKRPGLNGSLFEIYKFRTMREDFDAEGNPLPDADRLTRLGRALRASSLDELPELWNVVKGDMSLVGPRPLLPEYLPLYSPRQMRRHEVRPGLTGWAQINGRNTVSWEDRFELDVWYVDHRSFLLDLRILLLTILRVLSRSGITEEGEATMSKFTGNRS
jgi:lipopolysaccharide/colanic/teichoic acid biosynthesis glycosyltransferase